MPFQPLGMPIDILVPLPPAETKAAIRDRLLGWAESRKGARGWVIGPFTCLWLRTMDKYGPMLLGRLTQDQLGTRIRGRAGSDLNGVYFLFFMVALGLPGYLLTGEMETASVLGRVLISAAFVGLIFFILWTNKTDHSEAQALIRFLNEVHLMPAKQPRPDASNVVLQQPLSLEVDGREVEGPLNSAKILIALERTEQGDFMILSRAPERFIQVASRYDNFLIEWRDGSAESHVQAMRRKPGKEETPDSYMLFNFNETLAVLLAYASDKAMPSFLKWEPLRE